MLNGIIFSRWTRWLWSVTLNTCPCSKLLHFSVNSKHMRDGLIGKWIYTNVSSILKTWSTSNIQQQQWSWGIWHSFLLLCQFCFGLLMIFVSRDYPLSPKFLLPRVNETEVEISIATYCWKFWWYCYHTDLSSSR